MNEFILDFISVVSLPFVIIVIALLIFKAVRDLAQLASDDKAYANEQLTEVERLKLERQRVQLEEYKLRREQVLAAVPPKKEMEV